MCVDNVPTSDETFLEAKELKNQLINIFSKRETELHKWCENNNELTEISENNCDSSDPSEIKVLGVYWSPQEDCFSFRVQIEPHISNTKRDVTTGPQKT
ncbi:hypothetical protein NPIL_108181 [Nephila pilipes]|uniref:Uncharacterized protein n=1 Tax=Nephila pilipes TaxID=299642 RepID=A0A8X6MXQ6_NEPPI|nr:hypothetical protein NPIL_108181 [Nephila pilipes]